MAASSEFLQGLYQALSAERPYRAALSPEDALEIVHGETPAKLCPEAVAALERAVAHPRPPILA